MKWKGISLPQTNEKAVLSNKDQVSPSAQTAVEELLKCGIIDSPGNKQYAPKAIANRATVATAFMNLVQTSVR